jgi:ketosteroid isomerase-like protein
LTNEEKLRRMYVRFWKEGDPDAGEGVLSPDIEWHGLDSVGLDGDRTGPRGVATFFADWLEAWEDYDNDVTITEITPDLFLAENKFWGRGKGSGILFETEVGQVWEFKDGLAVRQTMYRTNAEAREAARSR